MKVFLTVVFPRVSSRKKSENSISEGKPTEKIRKMVFPSRLFLTVVFLRVAHGNDDFGAFSKGKPLEQAIF